MVLGVYPLTCMLLNLRLSVDSIPSALTIQTSWLVFMACFLPLRSEPTAARKCIECWECCQMLLGNA